MRLGWAITLESEDSIRVWRGRVDMEVVSESSEW